MPAIVSKILKNSIAEEIGFEKGDEILSINGIKPKDLIDYTFLTNAEEINLEVKSINGEVVNIEIEKEFSEDIGLIFESAIFDKIKRCQNQCIFCFVDQQPKGLRKTLYIKDDDYRLSYTQGTYITLTNLTQEDKERISTCHLGPLYISVHTTNPELRKKMLNNKKAGDILKHLDWLKSVDIPIHAQIVLCPTFNDGIELEKTLMDLSKYKKILKSIAIVPVGITKFREKSLPKVTIDIALQTIKTVEEFNKKIKKNLACVSDEFFLLTKEPIPERKYYNNFSQIEDGVGVVRMLLDDFKIQQKRLPKKINNEKFLHFALAKSSYDIFLPIINKINETKNIFATPVLVKNQYFGEEITVAGLLTGSDLINTFSNIKNEVKNLIIPAVMLKPFTQKFLDELSVQDVEKALNCKIIIINNCYSTKEIIDFCIS